MEGEQNAKPAAPPEQRSLAAILKDANEAVFRDKRAKQEKLKADHAKAVEEREARIKAGKPGGALPSLAEATHLPHHDALQAALQAALDAAEAGNL